MTVAKQVRIEPGELAVHRAPQAVTVVMVIGFLAFPLVYLATHPSVLGWTLGLAGVVLFGALVVWAVVLSVPSPGSGRAWRQFVGAVLVAVLPVAPLTVVWLTTACYFLVILVPLVLPARWWPVGLGGVLGLTAVGFVVVGAPAEAVWGVLLPAALTGVGTAAVYAVMMLSRHVVRERLAAADSSAVAERERIALDLHDLLGQRLTAIAVKSDLVKGLLPHDAERAAAEVTEVGDVARATLAELRDTVSDLRTVSLRAEARVAVQLLAAAGIETQVRLPEQPVSRQVDELLGWILREATTNVVRHSMATCCQIDVVVSDTGVSLSVADDGPDARRAAGVTEPPMQAGDGLFGIRARVEAVGGVLEWGQEGGWFRLRAAMLLAGI
ncbi:histidine kinase [Actinomycetes bacterium KLBMP 9759]